MKLLVLIACVAMVGCTRHYRVSNDCSDLEDKWKSAEEYRGFGGSVLVIPSAVCVLGGTQ